MYIFRLCGPTSTSRHLEVALRFGGSTGIILELSNTGYEDCTLLRSFDCSWLSNYSGEDEQLFMGGYYRIKLCSIRNINTNENFQNFFEPLYYFDCMVNGTDFGEENTPKITKKHKQILQRLIDHKLGIKENASMKYIKDTFEGFVSHKTELIFNLDNISEYLYELASIIMEPLYGRESDKKKRKKSGARAIVKVGNENVFKQIIFKIFKNVNQIIIYSTNKSGQKEYAMDKPSLLSIIPKEDQNKARQNMEITIIATHRYKL